MPKKIGRLGLRESPWEYVRERGFEWEREGRDKRQKGGGTKSLGAKKRGTAPPAGNTNPVKPTGGRHPASYQRPQ